MRPFCAVNRARTACARAAGSAERQSAVDLVLGLDQRVQDHRPAAVQVDLVGVQARILVVVRAPAIDLELAHALRVGSCGEALALVDLRVPGEGEFGHGLKSGIRSEEHTYELKSLMRISYAVF